MIVADTDVLIDFLRGAGPGADRIASALQSGVPLATTAVTRFELLAGARGDQQREALEELLAAFETLPLDEPAADRAAEIRRQLESDGSDIGMADSLIAGITATRGATLLTRNLRHFERIADLHVTAP